MKNKRSNQLFYAAVSKLCAAGGLYRQRDIAQMIRCKESRLSSYLTQSVELDQVELLLRLFDRLDMGTIQSILKEVLNPMKPEPPASMRKPRKKRAKTKKGHRQISLTN